MMPGAAALREKDKLKAKAGRERLVAAQLQLATAEAEQSAIAGEINNIFTGKVSQGFRAEKASGTVKMLLARLAEADEVVTKARAKMRKQQGFSSGEVVRM
jgi:hypothetical protein